MMTGSPNARDEMVNVLVRHRIDATGVERRVAKPQAELTEAQVAQYASCACEGRPEVKAYTFFARYGCECRRRWEYRADSGWVRVA
jgi:hypothetical protein